MSQALPRTDDSDRPAKDGRSDAAHRGGFAQFLQMLGLAPEDRAWKRIACLQDALTDVVALVRMSLNAGGLPVSIEVLRVSETFTRLVGCREEEACGRLQRILLEDGASKLRENIGRVFREGRGPAVEIYSAEARKHLRVSVFLPGGRDLVALIASDITPQKDRDEELQRISRYYSVLNLINQEIIRSKTADELLQQLCRTLVEKGLCAYAWAGLSKAGAGKTIEGVAKWGADIEIEDALDGEGSEAETIPSMLACNENRVVCVNDLADSLDGPKWQCAAARLGFRSVAAFPIREQGRAVGSVVLFSNGREVFSSREISLLNSAMEDIAFGFDSFRRESDTVRTQVDLRKSELRFKKLFEQAPVAYLTLDDKARIRDTNPAWHAMLRQAANTAPGQDFDARLAPEQRQAFHDRFTDLIESGRDRTMEMQLRTDDGRALSVIVEVHPEMDPDGGFRLAHCVAFDVTERKEFEQALKVSEERLIRAFEVANDGIWDIDLRTGNGYLSHRYYSMLGYTPGEFPGGLEHWRTLVHPDDLSVSEETLKNFLESGRDEFSCEHRMLSKDGVWKWIHCKGRSVEKDREGRKLRVLGTISDVTARRYAEEELQTAVRKYSSYISASPIAILTIDDNGDICEANPAGAAVFGCSSDELKTRSWPDLIDPSSAALGRRMLAQIIKAGKAEGDLKGKKKNSALLYLSVVGITVSTGRHLLFCQDVTAKRRTELALQARESMLESILHTAMDGFWIVDVEGRILEVNESYCTLSGYTHKELLQMRILDIEAVENLGAIKQHIERIRKQGSDRWETSHRRKDGSLVDVEVNVNFLPSDGGRIVVFIQDISDRKKAEAALQQSQRRLSLIIEGSSLAAWDWNISSGEIVFNVHWARMLGLGEDEMTLGVAEYLGLHHPDDAARVRDHLQAHFEGRSDHIDCEYRLRAKDGSWIWVMDRGQVIAKDSAGRPQRATGTQRNVTARRKAEESVRQQAALLDQTCDIVFATDEDGNIRYCNRAAELVIGVQPDLCLGQRLDSLLPDATPALDSEFYRSMFATGEWHGEITFDAGARSGRTWDSRWLVIPPREGVGRTVLIVSTDVTEKRMMESRFMRTQRMETIGSLAAGISHDLNNIFLPISLAIRMLKEGAQESQRASLFEMLDKSAQRGADIVRQLVVFSKGVDGRRFELQPSMLLRDIQKVIRETFPKNLSLQGEVPDDLWTIEADPTQIHQVLLSLCLNARDAMPSGGVITVSGENVIFDEHYAAMNPDADTGHYVVLSVSDNGVGIPPEKLDRIFDPFFTTKNLGKASDAGLSAVHGIVKSYGGFVQVRSKLGQGSSFGVYLKARPTAVKVEEEPAFGEVPPAKGETILLVDDEEAIRETLKNLLDKQGYRTLAASDGRQAMVCFVQQRQKIKAIVTDIMMPVMDGADLIRAIRSVDPGLPIIAMSGLPEKEISVSNPGSQASHFLVKPFVSEQLLFLLHNYIAGKEPRTVAEPASAARN